MKETFIHAHRPESLIDELDLFMKSATLMNGEQTHLPSSPELADPTDASSGGDFQTL